MQVDSVSTSDENIKPKPQTSFAQTKSANKCLNMFKNAIKPDDINLHRALEPVLRLGHATGMIQITRTSKTKPLYIYEQSSFWTYYSFLLLVSYLIISYFGFNHLLATDNDESSIAKLGKKITVFSNVGLCTVFIVLTTTRRKKIAHFLKTIQLVTTSLMKIGVKFSYEKTYLLFNAQIVIGILLCVIVTYVTSVYTGDTIAVCASQLISNFVIFSLTCQFIDCLLLMYQRFMIINKKITAVYDKILNNNMVLDDIRVLARCHDMLCDGANEINSAYMYQLLFFVLVVFITGLFSVFLNIKSLYRTGPIEEIEMVEIIKQSTWSMYIILMLIVQMVACESTSNQANDAGIHIHKMLITVSDDKVNQMLKTFSLQVMHRRLHFNACGMFSFDYTLLFSLLAAGTTYIVILVQFDQTDTEDTSEGTESSLQNITQ